MEDRMNAPFDLEAWTPPEAPVQMPYQVLERPNSREQRTWLDLLRQLTALRAPHE
jgi:hypothetical protein